MTDLPCLHLHLDGSLRASTTQELASALGLTVPSDLPFSAGMGLPAALSRFAFTLSLLQTAESVRRVASEICEDAVADGVTTLEIRFAPQLHTQAGLPIEAVVDAALEGIAGGRVGLLLCTLYGEDPAMARTLVDVARSRRGVVGIDLAGGPAPGARFGLKDYAAAFGAARDLGMGRTVHAGEGRPAQEIADAIEILHANRIGHGTTLLDGTDDGRALDQVLRHGITVEACPTSNWHVGAIPSVSEHPLAEWLRLGVQVCVNPDNTLLSGVTASEEHRRASRLTGIGAEEMARMIAAGHAAAFSR